MTLVLYLFSHVERNQNKIEKIDRTSPLFIFLAVYKSIDKLCRESLGVGV